jgi:hypothetical protein
MSRWNYRCALPCPAPKTIFFFFFFPKTIFKGIHSSNKKDQSVDTIFLFYLFFYVTGLYFIPPLKYPHCYFNFFRIFSYHKYFLTMRNSLCPFRIYC